MYFVELSAESEGLLKEIIKIKKEKNEAKEYAYLKKRFENLSSDEDNILRSLFSELEHEDLITIGLWAEGLPEDILMTNAGQTYFERKKDFLKEQKKLSHREWKIAIVSAIIGGLIGLIPYIITLF